MSRRVKPDQFVLYAYRLEEAALRRPLANAVAEVFAIMRRFTGRTFTPGQSPSLPVFLRWSTKPDIGFPRQPFKVYQRSRQPFASEKLVLGRQTVNGRVTFNWGDQEMYEILFSAQPDPGERLTIQARDRRGRHIPGQRIELIAPSGGLCQFRAPGIASLLVIGKGAISDISGVHQLTYANASNWELAQVVGFPFYDHEARPPVYNRELQGLAPASLQAVEAARMRLEIARAFHLPITDSSGLGVPTPDWPAPHPDRYLEWLRELREPALLRLIHECLQSTDDRNARALQKDYKARRTMPGMRQIDVDGGRGPDARADIRVVGVAMLAAASESYAATGLGYGTVAFASRETTQTPIPTIQPPGTLNTDVDFMVTRENITPDLPAPEEIAALTQLRPMPEIAEHLSAAPFPPPSEEMPTLRNRPPGRDQPATESVQLKWDRLRFPQGYGVVKRSGAASPVVLNPKRYHAGGYEPYVAAMPMSETGESLDDGRVAFVDPVSPLPISGTTTANYLVTGNDVMGRWSAWRQVSHNASAPPVIKPAIHNFTLLLAGETGPTVPAKMEIEFSWDWADRSPEQIAFTGKFFPAGSRTAEEGFVGGFALNNTGSIAPARVVIKFRGAGDAPYIFSGHSGSVLPLPVERPGADPGTELRRYRLILRGIQCQFTATERELAYALYARGIERVRTTVFSDVVGPAASRVQDPTPPARPALRPDLRWTALPDATNRARGLLTWDASAGAKGYVIWEATEAALRHILAPDLANPAPGTSLSDRALALRQLINANQAKSLYAFSRLNTALAPANRYEVELPGNADSIYAYRISAVGQNNKESTRSAAVMLFAVPHRNQPGQPRLILRAVKTGASPGVWIIAIPGPGPAPAGYRVHRVRRSFLLGDVGMMGPAKINESDSGWRTLDAVRRDATAKKLHSLIDALSDFERINGRAVFDRVTPGWQPYYYSIVALGRENSLTGEFRGESLASAASEVFLPPDPPVLQGLDILEEFNNASLPVTRPRALAVNTNTNQVYVTGYAVIGTVPGTVTMIDGATNRIGASLAVGNSPIAVAANPRTNRIYVANQGSNSVSVIDSAANRVIATIALNLRPWALAVNSATNKIYVTHYSSNAVSIINGATNSVTRSIAIDGSPLAVAINSPTNKIFVAKSNAAAIAVINGATDAVERLIALPFQPYSLAANSSTKRIYAGSAAANRIAVLSETTGAVIAEIVAGGRTLDLTVNETSNEIFALLDSNAVAVIAGATNAVTRTHILPGPAMDMDILPGLNKIFVAQFSANIVTTIQPILNNRVLRFRTNLPVKATPAGEAKIQLMNVDSTTGRQVRRTHRDLGERPILAHEVPEGTLLTAIPNPTPAQLAAMPEFNRNAPDAAGNCIYSVRLATAGLTDVRPLVIVTDPLNRSVEDQFTEVL